MALRGTRASPWTTAVAAINASLGTIGRPEESDFGWGNSTFVSEMLRTVKMANPAQPKLSERAG